MKCSEFFVLVFGYYLSGVGSFPASLTGVTYGEYSIVPFLRSNQLVPSGRKMDPSDIRFLFYNGSSPYDYATYPLPKSTDILQDPVYDSNLTTVIYIHGYIELVSDESVFTVVEAYLSRPELYNIIVMDWSNMAYGNYIVVGARVPKVSAAAGAKIMDLIKAGLSPKRLHIVGHSLGAHIAGYIGRRLKRNGVVLDRITGLDPAFPGYYPPILGKPMTPEDARFVDAIHTGAGLYGTPLSTAQVDFWPNNGVDRQPGCPPVTILFSDEGYQHDIDDKLKHLKLEFIVIVNNGSKSIGKMQHRKDSVEIAFEEFITRVRPHGGVVVRPSDCLNNYLTWSNMILNIVGL